MKCRLVNQPDNPRSSPLHCLLPGHRFSLVVYLPGLLPVCHLVSLVKSLLGCPVGCRPVIPLGNQRNNPLGNRRASRRSSPVDSLQVSHLHIQPVNQRGYLLVYRQLYPLGSRLVDRLLFLLLSLQDNLVTYLLFCLQVSLLGSQLASRVESPLNSHRGNPLGGLLVSPRACLLSFRLDLLLPPVRLFRAL